MNQQNNTPVEPKSRWKKISQALLNFYRCSNYFEQWRGQSSEIKQYFSQYGGWKAIYRSPYVAVAFLLSFFANLLIDWEKSTPSQMGLSILPNLLGFTMGGMAIVLAISSAKVFRTITEGNHPNSFFMNIIANFLHYIVSQAIALVICIVSAESNNFLANFISGTILIYCVINPVAIGVQLFQMAQIYNAHPADE